MTPILIISIWITFNDHIHIYIHFLLRNLLSSLWNKWHSKTSIHLAKLREGTSLEIIYAKHLEIIRSLSSYNPRRLTLMQKEIYIWFTGCINPNPIWRRLWRRPPWARRRPWQVRRSKLSTFWNHRMKFWSPNMKTT